jgi:Ca2+-binding RTX toxin-like protein
MEGGMGNDTYVVDDASDVIIELASQGTDTVKSSISYTVEPASNLENITLAGSAVINATGNQVNNVLTGNGANNHLIGLAGNDTLDGGGGADTMDGGLGNDTYVVDNNFDVIVEAAAQGTDTVKSAISYVLGADSNLENLTLTGSAAINATGNQVSNTLTGNSGSNVLDGGAGNDVLVGGKGADTLIGGAGVDRFDFNYLTDSPIGAGRDVISDFSSADGDKIDLSTLDANTGVSGNQAFTFIGDAAFSAAGQIRFADGVLQGNVNGDVVADFEIGLIGVTSLTASDFIA